jgi:hypothetical protein
MALDRIVIEIEGADAVAKEFEAKPAQIERAALRAIRKVTTYGGKLVAKELAAARGLPLSALTARGNAGRRVRYRLAARAGRGGKTSNARAGSFLGVNADTGNTQGVIWIGRNPIKAAYLGTPKQERAGARAGKHFFERAFVRALRSGHVGVFRLASNPTYRSKGRPADWSPNLPIDSVTVELTEARAIAERVAALIPQRLSELLRQELNYEVNVRV